MDAVTSQLGILNKEVADLAAEIKELNAKLLEETDDKKAEKLQGRINKLEAEKEKKETRREKLEDKMQGEGSNSMRLDYPHMSPAARDLLEKSTVIFTERSTDTGGAEQVTGCVLGFFISPQIVVSCQHNFAGFRPNDEVEAWLPQASFGGIQPHRPI